MSDSFSKIIAIFIASVMMFIVPVRITKARREEFNQTYVLSETMYLVDNVRNTGILSEEMYKAYTDKITGVINNSRIELISSDSDFSEYIFNQDIYHAFDTVGKIELDRYDYFKIIVYEQDNPIAYYGGRVK